MLNAYSRRKDGNALLSRSFRVREFACRDGSDPLFVDSALVQLLQSIRDHFGAPVVITSGYRTAAHNKAVGGAPYSQHCYGRAAGAGQQSFRVGGKLLHRNTGHPDVGGIGRYPVKAGRAAGWVHVDVRPVKSRWTG